MLEKTSKRKTHFPQRKYAVKVRSYLLSIGYWCNSACVARHELTLTATGGSLGAMIGHDLQHGLQRERLHFSGSGSNGVPSKTSIKLFSNTMT